MSSLGVHPSAVRDQQRAAKQINQAYYKYNSCLRILHKDF